MKPGSRILIVDDNDDFRFMLATALQNHGYLVTEAADGEEALTKLKTTNNDMAIVDLDMPKLNGLALSKKVKDAAPDFPIIMVTGYAQFYSAAEILSVGVDAFLQKPVPMEKLLDVINRM
ncbi:MAG TPA: two-component system response regulator [Bacteroidetes bacterium]|nr:two-component system response regulator [Bacteroidota bacterium]